MPWERVGTIVSGLTNGVVLHDVKRLYSVILTSGSDDAVVTLSWTTTVGGTKVIQLRCDSTGPTCFYSPSNPVAVGGRDITVTLTGTSPLLQMEVDGYELVAGPTTNLISRLTVLIYGSTNKINRLTVLLTDSKNMVARLIALIATGKNVIGSIITLVSTGSDIVSRTTVLVYGSKDEVNRLTVLLSSGKAIDGSITSLVGGGKEIVSQITVTPP